MRVALCSDTHVPSRVDAIPPWVEAELRAADHVVHAGDFDSAATLDHVRDLADDNLTAVRGNVDRPGLDLPRVERVTLAGVTFVVTHGDGGRGDYAGHVAARARSHGGPDAVAVAGHTHEPLDATVDGVRVLNPGSATGDRADAETMIRAEVAGGDVGVEFLSK